MFSADRIRKSSRKPKPRVFDNFVDCGILEAPLKSEPEPEVLLEVVSLSKTNETIESEIVKSTPSPQAEVGQFVLIDRESDFLKSPPSSSVSRTSSKAKKTDLNISKQLPKAKQISSNSRDKSKPKNSAIPVNMSLVPKTYSRAKKDPKVPKITPVDIKQILKRPDKATIADLKKMPELIVNPPRWKREKSPLPENLVRWGKSNGKTKKYYLNHKCPFCEINCATPSKLSRHIVTHKNDQYRRFRCDECGKGFIRKDYLVAHFSKVHLSIVNSKKKFEGSLQCKLCPTVFKSVSRMTYHVRANHSTLS